MMDILTSLYLHFSVDIEKDMTHIAPLEKSLTGSVLTDFSKTFNTINYDVFIAELESYGFDKNALELIYSCLKNRKQRIKIIQLLVFGLTYLLVYHKAQY